MTREQAIEMAKAKLKCMECETCGHDYNCDECNLNYEQGNMGEQKEWLQIAIKALDQKSTLQLGKTYKFAGYEWIVAELFDDYVVLQSHGVTHGAWADNLHLYDEKIQTLYSTIKNVDYENKGLYLVSKDKCRGFYRDALQEAALNYSSFETAYSAAWLGTVNGNVYAWYVYSDGVVCHNYNQSNDCVVAPAFNLDLSKIEVTDNKIVIKDEYKNKDSSTDHKDCTSTDAMVFVDKEGILKLFEDYVWEFYNYGFGSNPEFYEQIEKLPKVVVYPFVK